MAETVPTMKPLNPDAIDASAVRAPRLLVVDDILENRELLVRRFQRHGIRADGADGGRAALRLIETESYDVVLLDVMMPDMDGLEILRRIRRNQSASALPVVMVTARTQSEDVVAALTAGANDYLTKPVDFAVAVARVNAQIQRKVAEDEARRARSAMQLANNDLERRVAERTAKLQELNSRLQGEINLRQRSDAEIQYLAFNDALTGLANRRLFREQLQQSLADRDAVGRSLAVMFIDLDGFKVINDTLGHAVGDGFLKAIAGALRNALPDAACIARLGGDEFAIIHWIEPHLDASQLTERVLAASGRVFSIEDHELAATLSVGMAVAPVHGSEAEILLRRADLAMYRAKQNARGGCCLFEPMMDEEEQDRRQMELDLRGAIERAEFVVHYQPFMNAETGSINGVEALVRWVHPRLGLLLPQTFIGLAEKTGLIVPLGEWVLRQACADATQWPERVRVAVNLSPVQFRDGFLVNRVVQALADSGITPSRLELEITESVLLARTEGNIATLNQLRALGICIVMDDFGTGYSSLSCLNEFQFDKVKIDQMFVRTLPRAEHSRAIIRAVTGLGSSLGMRTTAEGVETEAQLNFLKDHGCDEVQGFLFSQPLARSDITALLLGNERKEKAA